MPRISPDRIANGCRVPSGRRIEFVYDSDDEGRSDTMIDPSGVQPLTFTKSLLDGRGMSFSVPDESTTATCLCSTFVRHVLPHCVESTT